MNATVTRGYVVVETPVKDCDGSTRTIDFPRSTLDGKLLYGSPSFHWTVAKYVRDARKAAVAAIKAEVRKAA